MNQEKIGNFISECRKEKKITQSELAEKLNISTNAVSKWERGICLMDMSLLKPLSELLGVSINEILNGEKIKDSDLKEKTEEVLNKTIQYSNNKLKRFRKRVFILVLFLLFLLFIVTFSIDYNRVNKNLDPLFMIPISENGNNYTYLGFGYKMKKGVSISPKEPLNQSQKIRFGFWIFTWNIEVFNPTPRNLWVINDENRILTHIGSYCITETKNETSMSVCGLSISLEDIEYKDYLDSRRGDVIALDSSSDIRITQITFYDLNSKMIDLSILYNKDNFKVPELRGDYIVKIDTICDRGTAWYSFKLKIN